MSDGRVAWISDLGARMRSTPFLIAVWIGAVVFAALMWLAP